MIDRTGSLIAAAFLLCVAGAPALAAEIEGIRIPDTVRPAESGPELVLNGAGLRTRVFFRVYVGALYLQQKTGSARAAIDGPGVKRVAMYMLRDVEADQFLSSLNEGLEDNHTPDELAKIAPQRKQLEEIFRAVKSTRNGDVILLDYAPGAGTRVTFSGAGKGTIPGEEMFRALLRVWLGDDPTDASLKKAMLGG